MIRGQKLVRKNSAENEERLQEGWRFIHENYWRQPTSQDVADGAGLGKRHYHRLFLDRFGISPGLLIRRLRKKAGMSNCHRLVRDRETGRFVGPNAPVAQVNKGKAA